MIGITRVPAPSCSRVCHFGLLEPYTICSGCESGCASRGPRRSAAVSVDGRARPARNDGPCRGMTFAVTVQMTNGSRGWGFESSWAHKDLAPLGIFWGGDRRRLADCSRLGAISAARSATSELPVGRSPERNANDGAILQASGLPLELRRHTRFYFRSASARSTVARGPAARINPRFAASMGSHPAQESAAPRQSIPAARRCSTPLAPRPPFTRRSRWRDFRGRLVQYQPVEPQLAYRLHKLTEVHRLPDVTVGPQAISVEHVLLPP